MAGRNPTPASRECIIQPPTIGRGTSLDCKLPPSIWFKDVYEHLSLSIEWKECAQQIEWRCRDFVASHTSNKSSFHCLLHLLGPEFAAKYFPTVSISYYYLKQPFLDAQQLVELQNTLCQQLKKYIGDSLQQPEQNTLVADYKHHLSDFLQNMLPNQQSAHNSSNVQDGVATIFGLYEQHLKKLSELKGCELGGSLREFVWIHYCLSGNQAGDSQLQIGDHPKETQNNGLVERILKTAVVEMQDLDYKLQAHQLKEILQILNVYYARFQRFSYHISIVAVHLYITLPNLRKLDRQRRQQSGSDFKHMVCLLNGLMTTKMWDSHICKLKAAETINILQNSSKSEECKLYETMTQCYANMHENVKLLTLSNREKIPMTLDQMLYEFYFHAFIGYMNVSALNYIWDQLLFEWDKLLSITIQMLCKSKLNQRLVEDNVCDAIRLYSSVKHMLATLTPNQLKDLIVL